MWLAIIWFFVLYLTQAMKTDGVILLSCNTDWYNESVVAPKTVTGNFKMQGECVKKKKKKKKRNLFESF